MKFRIIDVLWVYLLYYLYVMYFNFSSFTGDVFGTGLGMSFLIGFVLNIAAFGKEWKTKIGSANGIKLFAIPFCVSTLSATIKGKGYFIIFAKDLIFNVRFLAILLVVILIYWIISKIRNSE